MIDLGYGDDTYLFKHHIKYNSWREQQPIFNSEMSLKPWSNTSEITFEDSNDNDSNDH